MKVSAQSRRCVLFLCAVLLSAGVFARALENRLSQYRDDPSPTRYITKGARLAECRLDKLDVPAVVETIAILRPEWVEQYSALEFQIPTATLDFALASPHLRGPPTRSI